MRAIAQRIQRLEGRFSPQQNIADYQACCILYERRRRRFEREGIPFDESPPEPRIGPSRPLLPSEVIEARRQGRLAREAREAALRTARRMPE